MSVFAKFEHFGLNGTATSVIEFSTPFNGFYVEARHNLTGADVNIDISRTKMNYTGTVAGEHNDAEELVINDWKPENGEVVGVSGSAGSTHWTATITTTALGDIGLLVWSD